MPWSLSGGGYVSLNHAHSLLSLDPTTLTGDVIVIAAASDQTGDATELTISGGAVTAWHQFQTGTTQPFAANVTSPGGLGVHLLWGEVATGGAANITINSTTDGTIAAAQAFTPPSSPSEDTSVYGPTSGNADLGFYDAITPSTPGELWVGIAAVRTNTLLTYGESGGGSGVGMNFVSPTVIQIRWILQEIGSVASSWGAIASEDFATFGAFLKPGGGMRIGGII